MKILVIDDSPIHRDAAREQLAAEHDLTVVGNYEQGLELLRSKYNPTTNASEPRHFFDAILVDLLMPATKYKLSDEARRRFVGQEMPIGIFLALLAAKNGCAKQIAVFTDSNHHDHPASACLDDFNPKYGAYRPEVFIVADAEIILTSNGGWVMDGEKRWDMMLDYLLNGYKKPVEDDLP